jgi:hypothetical protein
VLLFWVEFDLDSASEGVSVVIFLYSSGFTK